MFSRDDDEVRAFPSALEPLATSIRDTFPDFVKHEAIFFQVSSSADTLMSAFLHDTRRGQAAGGIRMWSYDTMQPLITDGLRLSLGMGRKSALAGLWWGGGKGIIHQTDEIATQNTSARRAVYHDFGQFLTSLRGCYIGAEDVGTVPSDMANVFERTRFTTCIPPSFGGSGNPSPATALGVVCAMEAALDAELLGSLAGKTVTMQGAGNVAKFMMDELLERDVGKIIATDISAERVEELQRHFDGKPVELRLVPRGDNSALAEEADILAPNALGGTLNPDTIPTIRARIVCGGANNQLKDENRDAQLLKDKGVTFVPDYVCNRMGIVQCANEQYGNLYDDPLINDHFGRDYANSVYNITSTILSKAKETNCTPSKAARDLADAFLTHEHPIMPHRSWAIIKTVAREWSAQG